MGFEVIVETVFSLCLFVNAFLFVPQALEIYRAKSAEGQSVIMFLGFNLIQLFTILHAYIHNDWVLLIGNAFALVTCGSVTCLIAYYRLRQRGR